MFSPEGPTLRELAAQALSSVERGYDLLAPKFDRTPYRTPDRVLDSVAAALAPLGPFDAGLDLCCGTGAGVDVLTRLCRGRVTGVDFSAGMLDVARERAPSPGPEVSWVRGDARALPFGAEFDLVVSFGAFGHFLPRELPGLFTQVRSVLRPGGSFAFPVAAPPRPGSRGYWALLGFDAAMRVRNALWRPPFVMYYRTFRLGNVGRELSRAGFRADLHALPEFGYRPDGSPRVRMVVARAAGGGTGISRPAAA
ncbi:class I SAM-dependent methyltransferase [Streptomyces olivaceus]|uniref:Class I SAM-dependent methyltransferase n=1 Tax=Streptomyces olivaceus TaxID=47716 RepID=A0ABS7W914_STROV|nr:MULTISPECIES: class I SAM-dependent methyltransferase [Streptomyces]AOW85631.1 SAM-dependent methyltransferase [Streptomyces olivaceus]MBZ6091503.1 class I SAM-dependent methyltransferase [Streptomyces olivaceus]MBZ6098063.1 class I SAM-dependent methyltransferase [Streptomyces olivaceus]MBZ6118600.1 class I SAM-dependent methyltransferase [Streptomyces olivaceus]MBZ6154003.1 class I SAM-dependent methyltransferase [Streptomyces olivaceus]